jgi:hypothetical protein
MAPSVRSPYFLRGGDGHQTQRNETKRNERVQTGIMTPSRLSLALTLISLVLRPTQVHSFITHMARSGMLRSSSRGESVHSAPRMSTIAPPKRKTETRPATQPPKTRRPLEYLMDLSAPRGDNDPFHILLLRETFDQPKITIPYVVSQLTYTLDMPANDAQEHATFAKQQVIPMCLFSIDYPPNVYATGLSPHGSIYPIASIPQGMSCLGTWKRKVCLELGEKLQNRDIVCRVVPGVEGGGRPWQAKRADGASPTPGLPWKG